MALNNITYTTEDRTKTFVSLPLSNCKFEGVVAYANNVLDVKNLISTYIVNHYEDFIVGDTLDIINENAFKSKVKHTFPSAISGLAYDETCKELWTAYINKFSAIKRKMEFYNLEVRDTLYYKKKTTVKRKDDNGNIVTVVHNVGDVREVKYKKVRTPKTETLTFLCRYGRENTYQWLQDSIKDSSLSKSKLKDYKKYIAVIEEFGFDVLFAEAKERRKKVLDEYLTECVFVSNTFKIDSRHVNTFVKSNNHRSVVGVYAKLSIPYTDNNGKIHDCMVIPLLYNKEYHGEDLSVYNADSSTNAHIYLTIVPDEYNKTVSISEALETEVAHRAPTSKDVITGIDSNTVGHPLVGSDGTIIQRGKAHRKCVRIISRLKKRQKRGVKEEKKNAKAENRKFDSRNVMTLADKLKLKKEQKHLKSIQSGECADFIKKSVTNNKTNHFVMENLNGCFGKSRAIDKDNKQNFNDLTQTEGISDYKNLMKAQCQKKGYSFSTVQPEYTSQRCPRCGCIHKSNRPNQSTFECTECGYKGVADCVASVNIGDRVGNNQLCVALLKRTLDGYEPKDGVDIDAVYDVLIKNRGSGKRRSNKKRVKNRSKNKGST